MSKTDTFTHRLPILLRETGENLIKKHPKTLNHSWFYAEGIKATIKKAIEKGEILQDDPFGELIQYHQEVVDQHQAEIKRLTELREEHKEMASRTLAGRSVAVSQDKQVSQVKAWDKEAKETVIISKKQLECNPSLYSNVMEIEPC